MATGHANSKRKRGSTFAAPEPILLATYMTYYKISITSSQQDKIRFFNKYFKDPPHYNQLLTGQGPYFRSFISKLPDGATTPAPIELPHVLSGDNSSGDDGSGDDNSCGDEGGRDDAGDGEGEGEGERDDNTNGRGEASTSEISSPSKNHRPLVFSENMRDDNRTKAFLALKFLRDRLRLEARLEGKNFTFKIMRGGAPLRGLAHDIAVDMPALNDITDNYLFALFTTMIWSYRVFLHITQRWTGGELPESAMFLMAGELSQIDIESSERLQRKTVDKEAEIREEAPKERRALVASTSVMKDSHGHASKTPRSKRMHVVTHQGISQSSGASSTHRGRPFCDEDDEDSDSQLEYDLKNVLDDDSRNNNSISSFNWESFMAHDMTPAEFVIAESDRDDAPSRASNPFMSPPPPPPPLRPFSVARSDGSYSRGPYNKNHHRRHHQQPNISILDDIKTSISELDAKIEHIAQKINADISKINARLDELSKGQKGENGVSLKALQYCTQKDLERLEEKVNAMESDSRASRRISLRADVGSHEDPYNVHPRSRPPYHSQQLPYHQPYPLYQPYPLSYPYPSYTHPTLPPGPHP